MPGAGGNKPIETPVRHTRLKIGTTIATQISGGQGESLTCSAQSCLRRGAKRLLRRLWAPQRASLPITTRTRWRQCAKG